MASQDQVEQQIAQPSRDGQSPSVGTKFEGVVQSGPIQEPDQSRREQFAKDLDARVEAGRIDRREASHALSRYDNEQLVKMNAEDQRKDQGGKLQFHEDRDAPKDQAQVQQLSREGGSGLTFHEDRHPDQEHTMAR